MLLNTFERLVLLNNMPEQGDLTTIRIVHDLKHALSFTEEEHAALQFKETTNEQGVPISLWQTAGDKEVDIPIGVKGAEVIRKHFEKLSKEGRLTETHLPLCDKFEVGA